MAMPGFKGTLNLSGKAFVDEEAQVRAWFSRD